MNADARIIPFYECSGRFLLHAVCPWKDIRQGGCWRGRILDYCYQDHDCSRRVVALQAACAAAKRAAEEMDAAREAPALQHGSMARWRKAYDDWMSAYENHRDCPGRRQESQLFQILKRAGVVLDAAYIPDAARLGAHPNSMQEPIVGFARHYDGPARRY